MAAHVHRLVPDEGEWSASRSDRITRVEIAPVTVCIECCVSLKNDTAPSLIVV